MRKFFKYLPTGMFSAIATVLVVYMLLSPPSQFSSGWLSFLHFKNSDKVVHFLMFFFLGFAYLFDYTKYKSPRHTKLNKELAFTAVAAMVGLLTESAQLVMGLGRSFEVADIIFDMIGALAAFAFMRWKGGHLLRKYAFRRTHKHRSKRRKKRSSSRQNFYSIDAN
ncbi:MAG: VanZ family protein [Muribaculaceae bacterium]|nr:VanZ family protein [Muribaculaceae bacterium]